MRPPIHAFVLSSVFVASMILAACGGGDRGGQPPAERKVWFGNLSDGDTVTSPLTVTMKAENLIVEPAAAGIRDGYGHFHILVNVPPPEAPAVIPFDEQHIHYGAGDTVATLELAPGDHTLVLQFATGDHVPYDPQIKQTVRITVVEAEE